MAKKLSKKSKPKVGDVILIDYGMDIEGRWWWKHNHEFMMHGPFATEAEAQKDCETTVLGPKYIIKDGGMWDPAWDKKQ
jgi:hypothetical protein